MEQVKDALRICRDYLIVLHNKELMRPKELQQDVCFLRNQIEQCTDALETIQKQVDERMNMSLTSVIVDQEMAKTSTPAPDPTDGSPDVLDVSLPDPDEDGWVWDGKKDGVLVDPEQYEMHLAQTSCVLG